MIFDYIFLIGGLSIFVGIVGLWYLCLKMTYEAIKERESVFVVGGLMGLGFLTSFISYIMLKIMTL